MYRIKRHRYYNEYSELRNDYYTVEKYSKGWFLTRWRPFRHYIGHESGGFHMTTMYPDLEAARKAITIDIEGYPPRDGWDVEIVTELPSS